VGKINVFFNDWFGAISKTGKKNWKNTGSDMPEGYTDPQAWKMAVGGGGD